MTGLRINVVVASLMESERLDIVEATSIGCDLESARNNLVRMGVLLNRTSIQGDSIASWLTRHGYQDPPTQARATPQPDAS